MRFDRNAWVTSVSEELEARGFVRDFKAIPRSIRSFRRGDLTVELRACHLMRVLDSGGPVRSREYPNITVAEAVTILRELEP